MALIIFAFYLNLFNLYLKVVFLPPQPHFNEPLGNYSSDIEHYSMNGVELTNILPHMKDNLRNYLFNNANIALIKATNILRIFNTNFYEEHFGNNSPNRSIKLF
uniref:Uncharacterized protein n=1 Tax=Meloidogyne enterolobii TaxID=390850 RepID=A0A6V7XBN7_MELEN|nr:unnamed protein product [Meloidogyne enterolobii]